MTHKEAVAKANDLVGYIDHYKDVSIQTHDDTQIPSAIILGVIKNNVKQLLKYLEGKTDGDTV